MKKLHLAACLAAVFALSALVCSSALAGQAKTLRIGHPVTEDSQWHLGLLRFAELVADKSKGELKIEIYPNLTLGSEREIIEGMQFGSVDMGLVSTSITGPFTDALLITDLPFIFESSAHAHKVLNSEIGDELLARLEAIDIIGLAFFENGFRNIECTKPIKSMADIKGVKIRTVESPLYLETFEAFGANPIPMTWGDVYTALQQGTIDGLEGCIDNNFKAKMHEVAPYITVMQQIYSGIYVAISKEVWDTLTPDQQKALRAAAKEAAPYQQNLAVEFDMRARDRIRQDGGGVFEDVDRTEWMKATRVVYDKYADRAGGWDLIKRIQAMK